LALEEGELDVVGEEEQLWGVGCHDGLWQVKSGFRAEV
jgi:hypothetical protein